MAPSNLDPPPPRARRQPGTKLAKPVVLRLETVTPLFGGGPRTRTADHHTPVRVSGIRGQLRFWWRALSQIDSPKKLAEREREIFGGVFGDDQVRRSQVDLWISDVEGLQIDREEVTYRSTGAYALWPAASNKSQRQDPGERWKEGLRFRLHVSAPEDVMESDIMPALRAWLWFGGVGGRTRRGCGSLTVVDEQERWLPQKLTWKELDRLLGGRRVLDPASAPAATDMPSLRGAVLYAGKATRKAEECWTAALDWLKDFRQGAPKAPTQQPDRYARHRGQGNKPGRSNWPEPDKMRKLSPLPRGTSWEHTPVHNCDPAWPRAGFGLPINGRFIQPRDRRLAEPPDFQLKWHDRDGPHERLASPLIIKAMPLADGTFAAVALWLHRRYPHGGEIVLYQRNNEVDRSAAPFDKLTGNGETAQYTALRDKSTLKQAFCDWLVKEKRLTALKPGGKP